MIDPQPLADRIIELVGDRAEAQVLVESGNRSLTRFANSYIHQNVGEDSPHIVLKVIDDGRVSSAAGTRVDDDALRRLVERALDSARHQPVDRDWPGLASAADPPAVEHWDDATASADPAERARRVADFVAEGTGMRAAGYCETTGLTAAFANTAGQRVTGRETRAIIDGIHQTDSSAGAAHQAGVALGPIDGSEAGAQAARRARESASAYDIKPGDYEVVLAPECTATIAAFISAYGFNAKAAIEDQSFVVLGEPQFDPVIDLWDDVTDPRALGVPFDADGVPKHRLDLVTAGTSTALAHDRRTAAKMDTDSTGHAVPGGDTWGPFPTNVFVGEGTTSVDDMVRSIDRGLFVTTFNYCRILDPKTQVVTGLTRNGTFMIENGAITGAVTNLRFTQSFVEGLSGGNVVAVGNDGRFADSEFGPGFVHAPSLHLGSWNFTGGTDG
ncbi:MAG: TldD/PmbA family protein [Acidimicrobiia bacterium]|nr:TldD/PmbA family protein [Acidimicrobiia bacterium]